LRRKILFSKPYFTDEDIGEITSNIQKVLLSGWLTSGPNVRKLEEQFSKFIGTSYAVALNSCTAALHSVLLALDIKGGDEVIVPADTFVATANAALYVGARPVFADSDPETFNISLEDVQNKVSKRTKAIIAVHLGGNPCDMKELGEMAEDYEITLIEDCAHAHGAKYKGSNCGTFGVAGAFSFYPTKIMTTGEGGMITTDQKDLAEKTMIIRNHGRAGYGPHEIVEMGYNYRLSDIHAVMGLTQLKRLDMFLKQRNVLAGIYRKGLKISWIKPQQVRDGNTSSYYAYIVKLTDNAPITRDELVKRLNDHGVMTSIVYHPVHLQPLYVNLFGYQAPMLPVAEELGIRSFALPLYNGMSVDEANYVVEVAKNIGEEIET